MAEVDYAFKMPGEDIEAAINEVWSIRNVLSNLNLLINGDMRKPVNQKGLLEYRTAGYTIDMWKLSSGDANRGVLVTPDGLLLSNQSEITTQYVVLDQYIEFPQALSGKTVTFTAEAAAVSSGSYALYLRGNAGAGDTAFGQLAGITSAGAKSLTVALPNNVTTLYARMVLPNQSSVMISRAKLEMGAVSTLANDPPQDYGIELAKCQRHQLLAPIANGAGARVAFIMGNELRFFIPTPVSMRVNPTAAAGNLAVYNINGVKHEGFTFDCIAVSNGIYVKATKESHGLTDAVLMADNVLFDANL